jgi:hypothetical protein
MSGWLEQIIRKIAVTNFNIFLPPKDWDYLGQGNNVLDGFQPGYVSIQATLSPPTYVCGTPNIFAGFRVSGQFRIRSSYCGNPKIDHPGPWLRRVAQPVNLFRSKSSERNQFLWTVVFSEQTEQTLKRWETITLFVLSIRLFFFKSFISFFSHHLVILILFLVISSLSASLLLFSLPSPLFIFLMSHCLRDKKRRQIFVEWTSWLKFHNCLSLRVVFFSKAIWRNCIKFRKGGLRLQLSGNVYFIRYRSAVIRIKYEA